jgi:hypothetical protein
VLNPNPAIRTAALSGLLTGTACAGPSKPAAPPEPEHKNLYPNPKEQ